MSEQAIALIDLGAKRPAADPWQRGPDVQRASRYRFAVRQRRDAVRIVRFLLNIGSARTACRIANILTSLDSEKARVLLRECHRIAAAKIEIAAIELGD
jgi:hypothetical protein